MAAVCKSCYSSGDNVQRIIKLMQQQYNLLKYKGIVL